MKKLLLIVAAIACSGTILFNSCGSASHAAEDAAPRKMVVGYFMTDGADSFKPDYEKLTHICLAFAHMRGDGHLYADGIEQARHVIADAHDHGVKVIISLRDADNVSAALADTALRHQLVAETRAAVEKYGVDGVDVDYEEWGGDDNSKRENLEAFYVELREALPGKLLTAAVRASTSDDGLNKGSMYEHLDYVFPMVYDACGGWGGMSWGKVGQHSSNEFFDKAIAYFVDSIGVPKEKICPGVPFYGYEFVSDTTTVGVDARVYRDILASHPDIDASLSDSIGLLWYNGVPTIKRKAREVIEKDLAGIMIWEISQDTDDASRSLLSAIHSTFNPE